MKSKELLLVGKSFRSCSCGKPQEHIILAKPKYHFAREGKHHVLP